MTNFDMLSVLSQEEFVNWLNEEFNFHTKYGIWVNADKTPVELFRGSDINPKDSCWCSECGKWLTASDEYAIDSNYCPNCGAKMCHSIEEKEKYERFNRQE